MELQSSERPRRPLPIWSLLVIVLVIATSGLVYELLAGTLASYYVGSGVVGFSTTIGVYLFALGVGSWLSRYVDREVAVRFIEIELAAAFVGGFETPFVDIAYGHSQHGAVLLYGLLLIVGTLVGLEIPLLMRILKDDLDFKDVVGKVLTFDYLGALVGSLVFALVLVPTLGTARTSLLFGMLNAVVALAALYILRAHIHPKRRILLAGKSAAVFAMLVAAFVFAPKIQLFAEQGVYANAIIHVEQSHYQRVVVTSDSRSFQLWLNGNLQFNSLDEYRYHEALVHPAMAAAPGAARVLLLGGGDGLAAREILRYPGVRELTVVDLDPAITRLAKTFPMLRHLNEDSLHDERVRIVNEDALVWLDRRPASASRYDVIIADFPDPNDFALGKLYTTRFFKLAGRAMSGDSVFVMQSTSPLDARRSYWCIVETMEATGFYTRPYHASVPSFGEWGYVLAKKRAFEIPRRMEAGNLRYLTPDLLTTLFTFGKDTSRVPVEVNQLHNQMLVHYYESEYSKIN